MKTKKLNGTVIVTYRCNARCTMCNRYKCPSKPEEELSIETIKKLPKMYFTNITGGEPLLYPERLNQVLNKIFSVIPNAFVTINTNGINFPVLNSIDALEKIEGIHISRHHYNDEINSQIFGVKTASLEELHELHSKMANKKLIRLNCLLIKDYIDSLEQVSKYLDEASEVGVFRVGFVSLMPSNQYCLDHFVNFNEVFKNVDLHFFLSGRLYDQKICECLNGMYHSDLGKLIEFYARMTKELKCDYVRQLVYTANNELYLGFNNQKLALTKK